MDESAFARRVKDALDDLYDPIRLQTNPLVNLLGLEGTSQEISATALREKLREAIEKLRPSASLPYGRREWLGHRLLWLRYVKCQSQTAISQELGLSRATYYQRQQEAIEAVASILWKAYQSRMDQEPSPAETESRSPMAEEHKADGGGEPHTEC